MKDSFKYLLITLLTFLIFYGGSGVNLISYCCDDCRSAGWEVLTDNKCCDIHNHDHACEHPEIHDDSHCSNISESICCNLERVDFEWDNINEITIELEPIAIDLFTFGNLFASLLPEVDQTNIFDVESDNPPLIGSPRLYLSLLTTLLI